MRKIVGYATLTAVLCACPVTLSFAQGTTGTRSSGGAAGTGGAMGTNSSSINAGSMSQPYSSAPMMKPGTLSSGMKPGGTQSSIPGTSSGRPNGGVSGAGASTPSAAAGRPCGLSLSDPTSGSLTPLTQPLSPGSAAGGCE